MSKHTPGPWTVQLTGRRGTFHIPEAQRHEAEHAEDGQDGFSVSSANAALIAAAPELLGMLIALTEEAHECDELGKYDRIVDSRTLDNARAFIANATAVNRTAAPPDRTVGTAGAPLS